MQNEIPHVLAMKTLSRSSPTTASDYKTAGLAATIENGWPIPVITAHDDSEETKREIATWPKLTDRESVVRYLDWLERETGQGGVDYVKLMHESGAAMGKSFSKPSVSLQKIIVEEAKKRGYLTVAHTLSLQDTLEVLDAGVNGLTHTFFDQPPSEELVDRYVGAGAWVCPTLATIGSLTEEGREMQERYAGDERVKGLLDAREKGKMCRCLGMGGAGAMVEYAYESVRRLRERGVHVVWYVGPFRFFSLPLLVTFVVASLCIYVVVQLLFLDWPWPASSIPLSDWLPPSLQSFLSSGLAGISRPYFKLIITDNDDSVADWWLYSVLRYSDPLYWLPHILCPAFSIPFSLLNHISLPQSFYKLPWPHLCTSQGGSPVLTTGYG